MTLIFLIFSVFLVCKYTYICDTLLFSEQKSLSELLTKSMGSIFFGDSLYITNSPYDKFLCQFLLEPFLKIHNHRTTKLQI
jgi:hypothetical protein